LEYFGEKSGRIKVPDFRLPLLAEGNFIDACALFRKSLWEEIGGYDEQMPWQGWEDWDFWLRAAMKGATFGHLDEVGFHYRCRTGSMLSTTNLHRDELLDYIFSKKELWLAAVLRKVVLENAGLREKCAVLEKTPTSRLIGFAKSFFRQGPA
jgi:GT2 family glycosyltransferase